MNAAVHILVSQGNPTRKDDWDTLCRLQGNLHQSTFFDEVQAHFNQLPCYFEAWDQDTLLGGVKVYLYRPARFAGLLNPIAAYVLQAGEAVLSPRAAKDSSLFDLMNARFLSYLNQTKPVYFRSYGYYDKPALLLDPGGVSLSDTMLFCNAYLDLAPPDESWEAVHPHHRRKIRQATKMGYHFTEHDNPDTLLALLAETYSRQNLQGPSPAFIRHYFRCLSRSGHCQVYAAEYHGITMSAALVTQFGTLASYSYGGSRQNNDGAAHFLHWEISKKLRDQGYTRYFLGQVSHPENQVPGKFADGITPFKRRFGTREAESFRKTYTFKPTSKAIWIMISRLTGKR